jgi:signal transduction histidine kinase
VRERLVAALVGITVAVIAMYGVPRAYLLADLVETQETRKLERSADLLSVLMRERTEDGEPVTEEFLDGLLNEAEGIRFVTADGTVVGAGVDPDAEQVLSQTRTVDGGGAVTIARERELIDRRISEALTPLVLIGLALTIVSAGAGFWLARRLARPFQELADAATSLGSGRFDEVDIPHYSVPEAENIGAALRASADRLDELVTREREFAANASHQLRTPITALRLELEDLAHWPETHPLVAAELQLALTELDRLGAAITELLELARGMRQSAFTDLDLAGLADEVVSRWAPRLVADGRSVERTGGEVVPVRSDPGSVQQILDVLIENALDHGVGTVTVHADQMPSYAVLSVGDEGRGRLGPEVFRRGESGDGGTGLGLAVATQIAQSIGGQLHLGRGESTSLALWLPRGGGDETNSRDNRGDGDGGNGDGRTSDEGDELA